MPSSNLRPVNEEEVPEIVFLLGGVSGKIGWFNIGIVIEDLVPIPIPIIKMNIGKEIIGFSRKKPK